jgi:hypothetical protein
MVAPAVLFCLPFAGVDRYLRTNRSSGHRRFYLAVLVGRDLRPSSRSVMSGVVDSGREGGLSKFDANDPVWACRFGRRGDMRP